MRLCLIAQFHLLSTHTHTHTRPLSSFETPLPLACITATASQLVSAYDALAHQSTPQTGSQTYLLKYTQDHGPLTSK